MHSCVGDSGGPAFIPDGPHGNLTLGRQEHDVILGIVSFGGCSGYNCGSVYTDVTWFHDFIDDSIQSDVSMGLDQLHATFSKPIERRPTQFMFGGRLAIMENLTTVHSRRGALLIGHESHKAVSVNRLLIIDHNMATWCFSLLFPMHRLYAHSLSLFTRCSVRLF